ncbi:MAG: universal stress protein [Desulfobacter sp.]|nr:universal stress protein [Desulfobacter sp.]WDP86189.1 MAG: universal stress protein [Desulfobacter sp.]
MEKKVLIPVADCRRTLHALKYGVHATSFVNNLYFVLFHVQPMISLYLEDEAKKDLHVRAKLNKLKAKNKAAAQAILEKFKGQMLELGVDESRIELKTQVRQLGVAQDIIEFAHENLFDAILIGRRRISGIHKIFASSVSSSVLERSQVLPVWMVDGVPSSCKIMVAVDGSESALRAIDHVGFMVSKNPDIELTLVHITNTAQNYCEIDLNISPDPELVEIRNSGKRGQGLY